MEKLIELTINIAIKNKIQSYKRLGSKVLALTNAAIAHNIK